MIKYTAFIDILGFSDLIAKKITNEEQAEKFYTEIEEGVLSFLDFCENDVYAKESENFDEFNALKFNYLWISDTFVLSVEYKDDVTKLKKHIKSMMIYTLSLYISSVAQHFIHKHQLCIRGGITSKYTYMKDKLLLGEGISEAHYLESKIASNPRVIFSTDIITEEILELLLQNHNPIISKDCDGFYFVDFLNALKRMPMMIAKENEKFTKKEQYEQFLKESTDAFYASLKQMIREGLQNPQNKVKYMWMNEYFNNHNREDI